jgi:hypothetical protein
MLASDCDDTQAMQQRKIYAPCFRMSRQDVLKLCRGGTLGRAVVEWCRVDLAWVDVM